MKAKVWNDDIRDYCEEMDGKMYSIPAGKFVVMEKGEARKFLSRIAVESDGRFKVKKLRTEFDPVERALEYGQPIPEGLAENKEAVFKCNVCGKECTTDHALRMHLKHKHKDKLDGNM